MGIPRIRPMRKPDPRIMVSWISLAQDHGCSLQTIGSRCGASRATRRVTVPTDCQAVSFRKSFIINTLNLVMIVRFLKTQVRRQFMIAMLQFATLVITTIFAAATAVALHWLFLRAAFLMMRPATARRILVRTELVRGTTQQARAFASRR